MSIKSVMISECYAGNINYCQKKKHIFNDEDFYYIFVGAVKPLLNNTLLITILVSKCMLIVG